MTSIPYLPGTSPEHYTVVWDAWNRLKRVTYTPIAVPGGSGSSGGSDAGSDSYGSVSGSAGDMGSGSDSGSGVVVGSDVTGSGSSSSGIAAAPVLDLVYEYDGLFRRTRKQVLVGATSGAEYYWNLNWKCVVQRYYGTSTVSSVNYYGARNRNDLILKDLDGGSAHSGSRFYALSDAMFSTMAVVRPGSNVSERYRYTAFGERTIMDGNYNPISESLMVMDTFFHGEQIDEETGWYNYGYRYYVPQLGVWPSRDPIGERGGLNLYSYSKNCAINRYDSLGRIAMDFGMGASGSTAVTMGGGTVGVEASIALTYKASTGKACEICFQCSLTTKVGLGAGELTFSTGFVSSAGDETYVGSGTTISDGVGFNVAADGGASGGTSVSSPGTGSGTGASIGMGDPLGPSFGPAFNFYISKTYSGKICYPRNWWDPGFIAAARSIMGGQEACTEAWNAARKDNFGAPKL